MKNNSLKIRLAITIALPLTFLACSTKSSHEHVEQPTEETITEVPQKDVPSDKQYASLSKESADQLLNAYIEVKNALVETDSENAKVKAEALVNGIDAGFKSILQHVIAISSKIADSEGIEDQRVKFEDLSKEVYAVVTESATSTTVYKQYCPMAFNNKGAFWLSTEEQVLNPYFGDKMLKCGRVEETITANE